jgi:hypothetical protein
MSRGSGVGRRIGLLLAIGVLAIFIAVVLGQAFLHEHRRADVLTTAAQSPAEAASLIAQRFGAADAVCHPAEPRDDIDNLVSGLFALERFGTSPFETTAELLALRVSHWLGLTPPDFSYGPGQIRLSRALSLANLAKEPSGWQTRTAMASALLKPCTARRVARRLIAQARELKPNRARAETVLSHARVVRLAAAYNAQATPADGKAALAHHLFNRIAYHLTLHYRYDGTRRGAAPRYRQ